MKLGEVIKHRKGSITIDDNTEYKLCRVQLHRRGVVLREVLRGVQIKTKKQQVCKAGDFLVAEMDAKVGGYGFVPKELDGAIVSSHYFLFELDEERIRPGFLEVVSKLGILQDQIKATGSTNYAAIRPANVLDWEIPSLDIEHQIDIENLFTKSTQKSDELSSELTHQFSLVKQLRQAFLREAMQGKVVPQDLNDEPASELLKKIKAEKEQLIKEKKIKKEKELPPIKPEEIPFEIPKSWVWCRLGEICNDLLGGFAFDSTRYSKTSNNQVIRLGNVKPDNLLLDASPVFIDDSYARDADKCELFPGDILITMTGTRSKRDYLFSLLLDSSSFQERRLYLNQRVGCFRFSSLLSKPFLIKVLKDVRLLNPVFDSATGAANQANIGVGALKEILIPLPSHSEQLRVAIRLEQLMNYCDELEQSIKQSQTQNEQLLQQVLREALQPKTEYETNTTLACQRSHC